MKYYTISEASQFLGKSRQWIWFLIQAKRLVAEKIGSQYVIKEENLIDYSSRKI